MSRLKELKYFALVMLLCSFVAAGALSSCRDQKKEEKTEQAGEEEHPMEEGAEHPEGQEHPEGEEHPKDSVSG